jgi:hypothetical protein
MSKKNASSSSSSSGGCGSTTRRRKKCLRKQNGEIRSAYKILVSKYNTRTYLEQHGVDISATLKQI